ncbi:hypothetical protein B0H34DRAFT_489234 [Crassisporium funariophilum]|nr:hypothetical protein B0H34DRAFT_489234 [Crassisporium funariophilum]
MASATNHEDLDLESAAEFERIKQNFRSTMIAPDVPVNMLEAQTAFQGLQYELQEFLTQHITKVRNLQGSISNLEPVGFKDDAPATVLKVLNVATPRSDPESANAVADALSDKAICNQGALPSLPSQRSSINIPRPPLDAHMQSLNGFLIAHMENIRVLQDALRLGGTEVPIHSNHSNGKAKLMFPITRESNEKDRVYDALTSQFNMLVVIATFTAALIVGFLSLVNSIIGPSHRTAFSVGMLFSILALSIHFGNIIVAGRGAAITSQHLATEDKERDLAYFKYYLSICEQMQFVATLLFIISIMIMAFYIFTSLAFPLVLLFLVILGALVVFGSAYWKVSITFRNLKFLVKNFRRLRWRSISYLKTRGQLHT